MEQEPTDIAEKTVLQTLQRRYGRGCRSRCGRKPQPEYAPRRDSLTRRGRNKAAGAIPTSSAMMGVQPKRPRRMGLCSEVADGGEKSGAPPRPLRRYVGRQALVSGCGSAHRVFERKPAPDLIRGGYRFAPQSSLRRLRRLICGRKRVKTKASSIHFHRR